MDFEKEDFNFEEILDRFDEVVASFEAGGTTLCFDDKSETPFDILGFSIDLSTKKQLQRMLEIFRANLYKFSSQKLLRMAIYLSLMGYTEYLDISTPDQFCAVFQAFWICKDEIFDSGFSSNFIHVFHGGLQVRISGMKFTIKLKSNLSDFLCRDDSYFHLNELEFWNI